MRFNPFSSKVLEISCAISTTCPYVEEKTIKTLLFAIFLIFHPFIINQFKFLFNLFEKTLYTYELNNIV